LPGPAQPGKGLLIEAKQASPPGWPESAGNRRTTRQSRRLPT